MRLIDADKFKEELDTFGMAMSEFSNIDIIEMIDNAPTVEERKHGHWKKLCGNKFSYLYKCSNCGEDVMTSDIECYKYCHRCGAIMEEVSEDD